MVYHNRKSV